MVNNAVAIIPARYGSTRLSGKPLLDINGKPMIVRVWEVVKKVLPTYVATDDLRIAEAIEREGGNTILTSVDCQNGTARVAEAFANINIDAKIVLNIQGDEPMVSEKDINILLRLMQNDRVKIGTLVTSIPEEDEASESNCFVDRTDDGKCHDFRRRIENFSFNKYRHVGMYGFMSSILEELTSLKPTAREKNEGLEQLRWIENKYEIYSSVIETPGIGVDTSEDLKKVRKKLDRN